MHQNPIMFECATFTGRIQEGIHVYEWFSVKLQDIENPCFIVSCVKAITVVPLFSSILHTMLPYRPGSTPSTGWKMSLFVFSSTHSEVSPFILSKKWRLIGLFLSAFSCKPPDANPFKPGSKCCFTIWNFYLNIWQKVSKLTTLRFMATSKWNWSQNLRVRERSGFSVGLHQVASITLVNR